MVRMAAIRDGTRTESTVPRPKLKWAKWTRKMYSGGCPSNERTPGMIWRKPVSAMPKLLISSTQRLCRLSPDQRSHPPSAIPRTASPQSMGSLRSSMDKTRARPAEIAVSGRA